MKDNLFQDLDRLLLRKLELLRELAELTSQQGTVIDEEKMEELQLLIEKKNEIMEAVDQLDESLMAILDKFRTFAGFNKDETIAKIEEKGKLPAKIRDNLQSLRDILLDLQEIDRENLKKMNEKRAELGEKMLEIQSGRKANKGYQQDSRIYSTFIDRKG